MNYIDVPCECPRAGWCARHRFNKVWNQHSLCRESARYRRLWDEKAPYRTESPPVDEDIAPEQRPIFKTVGIGDLAAAALKKIGFKPCGGCEKRRAILNRVQMPWPSRIAPQEQQRETTWTGDHSLPRHVVHDPRWAVGVTTAYRSTPALIRSLSSLYGTGWTDVRVFAEPGSAMLPEGVPGVTVNDHVRGVFQNWRHTLQTLRDEKPDAEFYFVAQDDVIYTRNLKAFLEADLWFDDKIGFVSPYRSAGKTIKGRNPRKKRTSTWRSADEYIAKRNGCREACTLGSALWGALTYIFPRKSVDIILNDASLKVRDRMIDLGVHPVLAAHGREAWYYSPSLAEHVKGPSSIGHGQGFGLSTGGSFRGEEFDCMSLLEACRT